MKMTKFLPLSALALALALPALPAQAADTYTVDKGHTEVGFQIRHLVTKVRGRFNDFSGTIVFDKAKPESSSVEFKITAASIDTGIADRDNHLRAPDFFDIEKFPEITFKSTSVKAIGGDKYQVTGPFTMHGVTKNLTLTVEFSGEAPDPWGNVRAGFATTTTLARKDYGIVWNKALDNGGVILGEDVTVDINIEAIKKKDEAKK